MLCAARDHSSQASRRRSPTCSPDQKKYHRLKVNILPFIVISSPLQHPGIMSASWIASCTPFQVRAWLFVAALAWNPVAASPERYLELGQSESGDFAIIKAIDYFTEIAKQQEKTISIFKQSICYIDVGCFSRFQGDRMTHPVALPQDPGDVSTEFHLYSRSNPVVPTVVVQSSSRLLASQTQFFQQPKKLVVLLHGFTQSVTTPWLHDTKEGLLNKEDVNIMLVDWARGCRSPNYLSAVGNTALIGRQVSIALQTLVENFPDAVDPAMIHVVGFSLGGQASGFCGRHFFNSTGRSLGRITALDPAGPLFEDTDVRVTKEDAKFVDIIHTTYGWNLLNGDLGMRTATGHVDFYPNFQQRQPGCSAFNLSCGHRRAHKYFIESLTSRSCKFLSSPCPQDGAGTPCEQLPWGEMGYGSEGAPGRGEQFLNTNNEPPFCRPSTELNTVT